MNLYLNFGAVFAKGQALQSKEEVFRPFDLTSKPKTSRRQMLRMEVTDWVVQSEVWIYALQIGL